MDHDKRKLWIFMLNHLKPKNQDSECTLMERLGCIRSAAKVVSVPPEDPVFRGQAVLCVARAIVAEQDREPLEALEQSFRDILTQSAPGLSRFMSKLQATGSSAVLHAMGPNFADTCHKTLLTSNRPEPLCSGSQLRASLKLLEAGIRPSSTAMVRSLAMRAKLAWQGGRRENLAQDEADENEAALRVLSQMLCDIPLAPAGSMPEDLRESILEFLSADEVFEEPVAQNLRSIRDFTLCHKAYDSCFQHLQDSRVKTRRLNLLSFLAQKTPGLGSKHAKFLRGRLNHDPVHSLQGLRHLRRLLKKGLPKEDVQQVFTTSFQILKSGNQSLQSRHFATAAQLCADAISSFLPEKRKDQEREALFPPSKRRKFEEAVKVEDIRPFLSSPSCKQQQWMALSSFALEVCRLRADQVPEGPTGSMKFFEEIHEWLLRSFKATEESSVPGQRVKSWPWICRSIRALRCLFRRAESDEVKELLNKVLCQERKIKATELRWRLCILEAAAHEVPDILALVRWPELVKAQPKVNTWEPFPKEFSLRALRWWQALFNLVGTSKAHQQGTAAALPTQVVLQRFSRYVKGAIALKRGRRLLLHLAKLAAANGLQEEASKVLQRWSRGSWGRLVLFASGTVGPEDQGSWGCSLLERARHACLSVSEVANSGLKGVENLPPVIKELHELASNPLLSRASRAALRSWSSFAEMLNHSSGLSPKLETALHQASSLALARLKKSPFAAELAVKMLPLPRCLFGAYGGLEVRLKAQVDSSRRNLFEIILEGEPNMPQANKRHAQAIHAAWHSTELVAIDHRKVSVTLPRHALGPPLAFVARIRLRGQEGSTVTVKVTLKSTLGIPLAYGEVAVSLDETKAEGRDPPDPLDPPDEARSSPSGNESRPAEASPGDSFVDSPQEVVLPEDLTQESLEEWLQDDVDDDFDDFDLDDSPGLPPNSPDLPAEHPESLDE